MGFYLHCFERLWNLKSLGGISDPRSVQIRPRKELGPRYFVVFCECLHWHILHTKLAALQSTFNLSYQNEEQHASMRCPEGASFPLLETVDTGAAKLCSRYLFFLCCILGELFGNFVSSRVHNCHFNGRVIQLVEQEHKGWDKYIMQRKSAPVIFQVHLCCLPLHSNRAALNKVCYLKIFVLPGTRVSLLLKQWNSVGRM